jgi:hypothetical protein
MNGMRVSRVATRRVRRAGAAVPQINQADALPWFSGLARQAKHCHRAPAGVLASQ